MKALTAILLSLLILLLPLRNTLLVADYQLNKDLVAAVYCVNKDKPALRCEGKCHLAKELKAAGEQEPELLKLFNEKSAILFFSPEPIRTFSAFTPSVSVTGHSGYQPGISYPPGFSIFHPPRS